MKKYFVLLILPFLFSCQKELKMINPGELWPDNNGTHINAHGGGILLHNGTYYWYGEHKTEGSRGNRAWVGVHCYSSKNLCDWKDEGVVMEVSKDTASLIIEGCVIERPKVIFNKKTDKFVLWFHHELKGMGYLAAKTGVAVSESPTGPFEYIDSYNPNTGQWPVNFTEEQKT
ncbi:MAG: beta-glucanase, partial [Mariniphaga sp.]|nr:beta-glucanase [Mariniphaga sp.]